MVFTSIGYIIFLPVVVLVFLLTTDRARWSVLLLASIGFYSAFKVPYLLPILMMVTAATYGCGILLGNQTLESRRKAILWAGITINLLILILMKYMPFLARALNDIAPYLDPGWGAVESPVLASIGVSYYVFQAISYLIDVYLEIEEPERHFGRFSLFLCFFPKMLQGPIERAGDLLPQLHRPYVFSYEEMRSGLFLFGLGLFKKVVVADRLAPFVNSVYGNVHDYSGLPLILATYLYALQLYFDFSGYTDMALGAGRMFGIRLTQNFNSPYLATSVADFWRRWHISFSRWILDYIFKPLQMQMRDWKNLGTALALLITFIASGLWHGAGWNYIAWGLLHGIFLAASVFYKPLQKRIHSTLGLKKGTLLTAWQRFITFNLICFAWIFFRTDKISDGLFVAGHLASGVGTQIARIADATLNFTSLRQLYHLIKPLLLGQSWKELVTLLISLAILSLIHRLSGHDGTGLFRQRPLVRWSVYYLIALGIIVFGAFNTSQQFIYIQF